MSKEILSNSVIVNAGGPYKKYTGFKLWLLVAGAYEISSRISDKRQKIAAFHQFHDHEQRIHVRADAQKTEYIRMVKVSHKMSLLQKFLFQIFRRVFVKGL